MPKEFIPFQLIINSLAVRRERIARQTVTGSGGDCPIPDSFSGHSRAAQKLELDERGACSEALDGQGDGVSAAETK